MNIFENDTLWFHVSKTLHPFLEKYKGINYNTSMIYPTNPLRAHKREGNIPRICVSDQIINCLRSIIGVEILMVNDEVYEYGGHVKHTSNKHIKLIKNLVNPYVYVTDCKPFIPPAFGDFELLNERWFIYPTKFRLLGTLSLKNLFRGKIKINNWHNNKPYNMEMSIDMFEKRLFAEKFILTKKQNYDLLKTNKK